MEDAKAQLKSKEHTKVNTTEGAEGETDLEAECNTVINALLFQRLLTIFCAILDAASLSNNWILVNRSNAQGSSASGELLLELAIQQTSQRPVIVVIESLNRLRRFTNDDGPEQVKLLNKLRKSAVQSDIFEREHAHVVKMEAKYHIDEFGDYRKLMDTEKNPLPSEPHHDDLNLEGVVAERARWGYHYQSAMFSSGTHYIILDGDETVFPVTAFGQIGNVCAHGSTRAYQRIRNVIQQGRPLVMLNNTGGVTQAFSSLQKSMLASQASDEKFSSEKIIKMLGNGDHRDAWTANFGIPEIMMFRELMHRAPLLFQKTIVVVDLVKDSAEEVLSTVTACFASSFSGVPELGIGNAESAVVYNAWKRHLVLYENGVNLKR